MIHHRRETQMKNLVHTLIALAALVGRGAHRRGTARSILLAALGAIAVQASSIT